MHGNAYTKGLIERFKKICNKHGMQVYFKGVSTIKNFLVVSKDRNAVTQKSGVIYRYNCDQLECDEKYIGESARTFGERFKEHRKSPSPIDEHSNTTGHHASVDNFSKVGKEVQNITRAIKDAIFIRGND